MKNTTNLETVLDGVRFGGQVAHEEHAELGPLLGEDALRVFDAKIVQSIASRGLYGPEMFRFVRKFARIGIGEAASLLRADRKTVRRWESGETILPLAVMAVFAVIADERRQDKSGTLERLKELSEQKPEFVNVDDAA